MNSETPPSALTAAEVAPPTQPLETLTYSVTETARVLGVSLPTVYRLFARRLLKPLPGLRTIGSQNGRCSPTSTAGKP